MNFQCFYGLKLLQEEWGYNYTNDSEEQSVNWIKIDILKMTKDKPSGFFVKDITQGRSLQGS